MKTNSDDVVYLDEFKLADAPRCSQRTKMPNIASVLDSLPIFLPSIEHSENVIIGWIKDRQLGVRNTYAVRDANSSSVVGGCEIRPKDGTNANLSYWTHPAHRGRGIATRAVSIAYRIAAGLGITQLEILVDEDNAASRQVAIKNGFKESGVRDGRLRYYRSIRERASENSG